MSTLISVARLAYARTVSWLSIFAVTALLPSLSFAGPINLNELFHEDGAPITIAADGSSAVLGEDPAILDVFLSNLPGLGDPELLVASPGAFLMFDYNFDEAPNNANTFGFAILDGLTGVAIDPFSLFFTDSIAGTAVFDLTSLVGRTLGFQFDFGAELEDQEIGSTLTIANLRIETPDQSVPEPGSLALLAIGLLALVALRRNKRLPSFS